MIHELTEMVATWLDHPTYGVNALSGEVERLETDDPPPAIDAVYHAYRDDWIAQDKEPLVNRSLVVAVGTDIEAHLATGMPTGVMEIAPNCTVAVFLVTRDTLDASAMRAASYLSKAVRQSLHWLASEAGVPSRKLRSVTLVDLGRITEVPLGRAVGNLSLASMTVCHCMMQEGAP